jgi:catechol 2,3-dioxygenase-like lactoylglutathione lyase family enzyme
MKHTRLIFVFILVSIQLQAIAQVKKVEAIGITVSDMDRSVKFYSDVLGFAKTSDEETHDEAHEQLEGLFGLHIRVVRMQLGDEQIELTDYITAGGRSIPEDARANDLFFQHIAIVVSDMDKAYTQLQLHHVVYVSTAPQTLPVTNTAAAGIKAFYFQDPDRHNLELIYFPKGKGQDKWQHSNGKIFLGIDHTAIGISNTEASLHFYQVLLGIEPKGESFNFGTEQEHLNNVEGASLHITGLRTAAGPGIEFLHYLKPGAGKAYPVDIRADDIWYWQTVLITDNAENVYKKLKEANITFVSKGLINLGNKRAFVVRDPDGHALLIIGG